MCLRDHTICFPRPLASEEVLFLEWAVPAPRRFAYAFWLAMSALMFGVCAWMFVVSRNTVWLLTGVPLSIGTCLVPFGVRSGYRATKEWGDGIRHFVIDENERVKLWFTEVLARTAGSKRNVALGLLFGGGAVFAFRSGGAFDRLSTCSSAMLAAVIIVAGYVAFAGLFGMLCLSRIVWGLGQFKVRVENHEFGVLSAGTTLVKRNAQACGIWFFFALSATFGLHTGWVPLALLALPSVLFLVGAFVVCQFPLHAQMVTYKRDEIQRISALIRTITPSKPSDVTEDRQRELLFFQKQFQEVASLPEWPFKWPSMVKVTLSSSLSVLPAAIELLPKILKP